jgi:hypothetical protein
LKAKGFLDFGPSKVIFGMPGKYSLLMVLLVELVDFFAVELGG